MARNSERRGSNWLGIVFMVSVFGPMILLAILWAIAAGVAENGTVRDQAGLLMVWVLLGAGIVVIIEEAVLFVSQLLPGKGVEWPKRSLVAEASDDAPAAPASSETAAPGPV